MALARMANGEQVERQKVRFAKAFLTIHGVTQALKRASQ
jgi:hypothetical protein